jgi:uncharacterized membrane protein (DUF373 family)
MCRGKFDKRFINGFIKLILDLLQVVFCLYIYILIFIILWLSIYRNFFK